MSSTNHVVHFGEQVIEYALSTSRRKTLGISVQPDLTVEVTAPQDADLATIEAAIRGRAPWILRQQQDFAQYLPHTPPRQYISGESHRYLGKQYRLKVVEISQDEPEIEWVKLTRGYLWVRVVNKEDRAHVAELVEGWYRKQAKRVFGQRLDACYPRVEPLGIPWPALQIRKMENRWGSCTTKGTILLNLQLMQTPKECIDYIILHELCHLKEHNHGPSFYALLSKVLPDWERRRERLNQVEVG